ncbi:MAG: hypothetical protein AB1295_02155 [Candidatus Micrarchaeota archaeon]
METRSLAKRMAKESGQAYAARGKKAIGSMVEQARKTGDCSIEIVEELDGKPYKVAMLKVDELGNWEWAGERLLKPTKES